MSHWEQNDYNFSSTGFLLYLENGDSKFLRNGSTALLLKSRINLSVRPCDCLASPTYTSLLISTVAAIYLAGPHTTLFSRSERCLIQKSENRMPTSLTASWNPLNFMLWRSHLICLSCRIYYDAQSSNL